LVGRNVAGLLAAATLENPEQQLRIAGTPEVAVDRILLNDRAPGVEYGDVAIKQTGYRGQSRHSTDIADRLIIHVRHWPAFRVAVARPVSAPIKSVF
jgi:hypothetical protein